MKILGISLGTIVYTGVVVLLIRQSHVAPAGTIRAALLRGA